MKVENIESNNGNKIANQFIITDDNGNEFFQSYNSMIVKKIVQQILFILIKNIGTIATLPANIEIYFQVKL